MRKFVLKFRFPSRPIDSHYLYMDYASIEPANSTPGLVTEVNVGPANYNSSPASTI